MPKMKPDRDDRSGGLDGNGGPQTGPTGGDDRNQQKPGDATETGGMGQGEGGQRRPGGSSRDD